MHTNQDLLDWRDVYNATQTTSHPHNASTTSISKSCVTMALNECKFSPAISSSLIFSSVIYATPHIGGNPHR